MEELYHDNNWEHYPVDPLLVAKYYVIAHILLDKENATDSDDDDEKDLDDFNETMVFLQVFTAGVTYNYELDSDEFRDSISARIPYYHRFGTLTECLTFDELYAAKCSVLVLDVEQDRYVLKSFDEHFIIKFDIKDDENKD